MSTTTYERYKAAGVCVRCARQPADPGRVACTPCRFAQAHRLDPSLTLEEWHGRMVLGEHTPTSPVLAKHIPGPAVGHCGQFWPAQALPVRCRTCGGVALGEETLKDNGATHA